MVKLNFTKTAEIELLKLAKAASFDSVETYLEEQIIVFVLNELTMADVEKTKEQIQALQTKLSGKREEILLELREQKVGE